MKYSVRRPRRRPSAMPAALGLALLFGEPHPFAFAEANMFRGAEQAPPTWIQFSKLLKFRFEEWVAGDSVEAQRFQTWGKSRKGTEGGPPESITVKVWAAPDGKIEKLSFAPLNDPQAEEDLRTILTTGNLGEAPPPDMLQPVNLRVSLLFTK